MGLRLKRGISKRRFKEKFNENIESIYKQAIDKNIKRGLLYEDDENIALTDLGMDFSNDVMSDFIFEK